MTTADYCILVVILMPYFYTILVKSGRGYNHKACREYIKGLTGWRQRAYWGELNSFEAMPAFIAAVLVAQQIGAPQISIDRLAVAFVGARILYGACYIFDLCLLRTITWTIGFLSIIGLFAISM